MFAYGVFVAEQRYVSWFMGCMGLFVSLRQLPGASAQASV
jgi:hypothetical protein